MANQIIIDIGAVANDGTGDPLRTAFGYVNDNFSNIWATGVANSNISFSGNKILTTNTNGNLVLAPNGTGKVQANVDIVPNANNTLSLGSLTRKWNTIYTQYVEVGGEINLTGDLSVGGNLTVTGDIIEMGNIVTDAKTIQLANTAGNASSANGSGITVGANDDIATMLYSSTSNVWTTNIGITATGNITGTYFIGNGSLLTGITSYGNANVAAYLASGTNTSNIITTNNISANNINFTTNLYGKTGTFSGDTVGDNSLYAGVPLFTTLGSDVVAQFSGNVNAYTQFNFQNGNPGAQASGDYVITADNGNDSTHFLNLGITSSNWDGTQPNSLGNRLGPNDGYLYIQDGDLVIGTSNGTIETWKFGQDGTLTVAGDIIPTANNAQNLGSATYQWNDLYLSNATIYMNSVPISLGAGNVLTVNGADVVTTDANGQANIGNLDITGTYVSIAPGASETIITLSPNIEGQAYLQMPNDATANVANVRLHNDVGNIELGTGSGSYNWYFDNAGNLSVPVNINFNGGGLRQVVNEDFYVRVSDNESDGWSLLNVVDDGAGNDLTQTRLEYNQFSIRTNIQGATSHTWQFNDSGTLGLPGNIFGNYGGNLFINIGDQFGSTTFIDLRTTSYVGDALISNIRIGDPNITISTASGGNTWTFGSTGTLTFPSLANISGGNFNAGTASASVALNAFSPDGNTVSIQAQGNSSSAVISIFSNAGPVTSNWTFTTAPLDPSESYLYVPPGGAISTPDATGGQGGKNIFIQAGASDPVTWNSNPGGELYIKGGYGSFGDGGGGPGGNVNINGGESSDSHAGNVNITAGAFRYWTFDYNGNLSLPPSGNIVGLTANNNGYLNWFGNSSGDNNGYTTLRLVPDDTRESADQYLIVDPTAPGHIHIRAGGTQDNSNADLFLGGENSYFKIAAGSNSQATISSNSNAWVFNTDGNLQVPGNINGDNSAPLVIDGASSGEGFIRLPSASFGGEQVAIVNQFSLGNGIALTTNGGTWHFGNSGAFTSPGAITATGTVSGQVLISTQSAANEGGEIQLALPSSGTTLTGNIIIDSYQNQIRFFESSNSRGLYVDVPNVSASGQYAIGYRDIPQLTLSGNVVANSLVNGKHFYSTNSGNLSVTIPDNANVAFPIGTAFTIVVQSTGNVIVDKQGNVSLYMAGNSTSANRAVGTYGMATVMKVATDTWFINGTGVS